MANPSKAKGTQWESAVRDYLNRALDLVDESGKFRDVFSAMNVRRPAQEGAEDVGDVHAAPFILECKAVKKASVPAFLRQADVEARHAGFPYGVAVCKVPRANVKRGKVHLSVSTWTRVRTVLGLTSREMWNAYGFTLSARGLDTGKRYFTTDLDAFSSLLSAVRSAMTGGRYAM